MSQQSPDIHAADIRRAPPAPGGSRGIPPVAPQAALPVNERPAGAQASLVYNKWFVNGVPLATSIAIHASIIVIGLVLLAGTEVVRRVTQEQIIIPDATIIEDAPVGGVPQDLLNDPTQANLQIDVPQQSRIATESARQINEALMSPGSGADTSGLIGSGAARSFGDGIGDTAGEDVGSTPFGVPAGGGGPPSSFMGISGNARRIIYICDASGSMIPRRDPLERELRASVMRLKPIQGFNIIYFCDDGKVAAFHRQALQPATATNKARIDEFLRQVFYLGTTRPLPAIRMAFAQQPELIYLLTDGLEQVDDLSGIVAEFRRLNVGNKVKVNTILIGTAREPMLEDALKTIARDSGGVFKQVDDDAF